MADLARVARRDREAVVLGGDENPLRAGDADRVVGAAVAERELEGLQAEREPDELVAEADPEERHLPEQLAHRLDRAVELRRVAGAVADQHRRRVELEHGLGVPRAGHDDCLDARLGETPHDRALAAEVEDDDAWAGADGERLRHARVERRRGRCELGLREHARPVEVRVGERAGVQLLRRAVPSAQRIAPSSRRRRTSARVSTSSSATTPRCASQSDQSGRARRITTPSVQTSARLEQRLVDAVVADERGGECEHLARVARVGDGLLVAGRRGREAGLAGGDPGRADGASSEDGAVLEHESRVHRLHSNHNSCIIRIMRVTTDDPRRLRLFRPGDARPRARAPGARARRARLRLPRRLARERPRPAAERLAAARS